MFLPFIIAIPMLAFSIANEQYRWAGFWCAFMAAYLALVVIISTLA